MSTPARSAPRAEAASAHTATTSAADAGSSRDRQRIRWFVAGHVGAITLIYLVAAWFGDGWAPPPFPPDLSPAERQAKLAGPAPAPGTGQGTATGSWAGPGPTDSTDLQAPWHQRQPDMAAGR